MTPKDQERYEALLRQRLSDHRMKHSLGVMREAEILARIHGADTEKARIAGLLHDMTKEFSREEHFRLFDQYGHPDPQISESKNLWHAESAYYDVTHTLGITDDEIRSAVRYHTTGNENMTLLQTILFVADLTDETRTYDDVDFYRAVAREDVTKAAYLAMGWCIEDLKNRGLTPHPRMLREHARLQTVFPSVTVENEKQRRNL